MLQEGSTATAELGNLGRWRSSGGVREGLVGEDEARAVEYVHADAGVKMKHKRLQKNTPSCLLLGRDSGWWANFAFLIGSILYVVTALPAVCSWEESGVICCTLNAIAAAWFILDSALYYVFYLCDEDLEGLTEMEITALRAKKTNQGLVGAIAVWLETQFDAQFWGNLLFMVASIFYFFESLVSCFVPDRYSLFFAIDLVASHAFVFDGGVYVLAWWAHGRLYGFRFTWNGLGDWLFFIASLMYAANTWISWYELSDAAVGWINFIAAVMYVFDALCYMRGFAVDEEDEDEDWEREYAIN